jgi:hypothetical protein
MRWFEHLGGGCNTIVESHVPDLTPAGTVTVETIDLPSVLREAGGHIRLCKMDCEGAELDLARSIPDPSQIDAFALEFHPHAYHVSDLVKLMTAWGTHHVSVSPHSQVLYAVSHRALEDYATQWS